MDAPIALFRPRPGQDRLSDLRASLAQERAALAAGQAEPCGTICDDGCHGPLVCIRAQHPHDPQADMGTGPDGRPLPKGDVSPHVAEQPDGTLVQWTCLPGDHDGLTDEQRTEQRAATQRASREQATRDLLASVNPALLAQLLREGEHLA